MKNQVKSISTPWVQFFTLALAFLIPQGLCNANQDPVSLPADKNKFPITLTDDLGYQVVIESPPERIISLTPSNTEILCALGLEERVVAVSDYCDYPPSIEQKPRVGGMIDFNVESIALLEPDFVLAVKGNADERLRQLQALHIPVFSFDPRRLEDIYTTIHRVGLITGTVDRAAALIQDMKKRIDRVRHRVQEIHPRKRVYYGSIRPPYYTANGQTYIGEILELAGGENIAQDLKSRWPQVPTENLLVSDPEVVIVGLNYQGRTKKDLDQQKESFRKDRMWSLTTAGKNGAIHTIDPNLIERPGPRVIEAAESIARFLYPDCFPK